MQFQTHVHAKGFLVSGNDLSIVSTGGFAEAMYLDTLIDTVVSDNNIYVKTTATGAANYGMGLLLGNQGFFNGDGNKGTEFVGNSFMSSILYRTYLKTPILTPFNFVVDGLFEVW